MAIPQKHSRKITVSGVVYRWCLNKDNFRHRLGWGDRITVQAADHNGARLIVHLHPFWCDEPSLTPKHVAGFIHDAVSSGWSPLEPGPPFELGEKIPRSWT